jgi:hypothetical protein
MRLFSIFICLLGLAAFNPSVTRAWDLDAMAFYNQGIEHASRGNTAQAILLFQKATRLDPQFADAFYNLGVCQYQAHQYEQSAQSFRQVLRFFPSDRYTRDNLSMAMAHLPAGKAPVNRAPTVKPSPKVIPRSIAAQPLRPPTTRSPKTATAPAMQRQPVLNQPLMVYGYQHNPLRIKPVLGTPRLESTPTRPTPRTQSVQPSKISPSGTTAPIKGAITPTMSAAPKKQAFASGFMGPTGMVLGPNGKMYVANYMRNEIYQLSPSGQKQLFARGLNGPIGLVFNPKTQDLYVANYRENTIARVSSAGKVSTLASGFKKPYQLMLDETNQVLFVSEQESNAISRVKL